MKMTPKSNNTMKKIGSGTTTGPNQSHSIDMTATEDMSTYDKQYVGEVEKMLEPIEYILSIRDANMHNQEFINGATQRLNHFVMRLLQHINSSLEKILPLKTLNRCLTLQNEESLDEELKARYLIAVLREFRKNREMNRQIQTSKN